MLIVKSFSKGNTEFSTQITQRSALISVVNRQRLHIGTHIGSMSFEAILSKRNAIVVDLACTATVRTRSYMRMRFVLATDDEAPATEARFTTSFAAQCKTVAHRIERFDVQRNVATRTKVVQQSIRDVIAMCRQIEARFATIVIVVDNHSTSLGQSTVLHTRALMTVSALRNARSANSKLFQTSMLVS